MSENILDNIITKKIERIDFLKKSTSLDSLNEIIDKKKSRLVELKIKRPLESFLEHPTDTIGRYNFKKAIEKRISNGKISLVAESKKASPSAGVIIKDYNPVEIAKLYQSKKATCLSILTEEDFFFRKSFSYL